MTTNMEYLRKLLGSRDPPEVYPDLIPPDIQPGRTRHSRLVRTIGRRGARQGCFNSPGGIAVTKQGTIIVADTENHRLQLFHPDGQLKSTIGQRGSRPHHLNHPLCVTLTPDSAQNIMVTDSVNACVKVFRQDGSFVAQYTECGDFPYGIAVTSDYYMVTSDLCKHCIVVLHPSGNKQYQFGEDLLNHPYYIACDNQDNIVVSDSGNSSIKRFQLDGTLLQNFSLTDFRLATEGLILLQGLTVDSCGNLLVIGDSTVYICAANGRLWEVLLPDDGLHSPKCLAFCQSGKLVLTQCGYDNRHEVTVCEYNTQDFRSLQLGPLSYNKKRKASSQNSENKNRLESRSRSRMVSWANSSEESPTSALCSSVTMSHSGMSCSDS